MYTILNNIDWLNPMKNCSAETPTQTIIHAKQIILLTNMKREETEKWKAILTILHWNQLENLVKLLAVNKKFRCILQTHNWHKKREFKLASSYGLSNTEHNQNKYQQYIFKLEAETYLQQEYCIKFKYTTYTQLPRQLGL
jgi:hypothetical protein